MESLLELQRHRLEERERLEKAYCDEALADLKSHKAILNSEHKRRQYIERYIGLTKNIHDLIDDTEGKLEHEKAAMGGQNPFTEFYRQLKELKDYYKPSADEVGPSLTVEFQKATEEIGNDGNMIEFTDEEGYGKYLDLAMLQLKYLNLKKVEKCDYLEYLNMFSQFDKISGETKKSGAYKEYLVELSKYLTSFTSKTKPLINLTTRLEESDVRAKEDFDNRLNVTATMPQQIAPLDLNEFGSVEELVALGGSRLKGALLALKMKCGGTELERAERLWKTKGQNSENLQNGKDDQKNSNDKATKNKLLVHQLERRIQLIAEIVKENIDLTKENVQRKQARGFEEEEEEDVVDDAAVEEALEEAENDDVPANPKNLPLGWDGKPIPYWLYKLHGLNLPYPCEICGNHVYKGPKNFQKHFTEWRHSHGLRCLGIQNSAHFVNITNATDAKMLWEKIQVQQNCNKWNAEDKEEYEDSAGNVITKKTYEDLKRQRLL
uniref:Matrin-type domain-containing protein n=1 Tax=Rhabditophanes sp. KR3021 TaxID=114890 RepID=A0AC35U488_9BILA